MTDLKDRLRSGTVGIGLNREAADALDALEADLQDANNKTVSARSSLKYSQDQRDSLEKQLAMKQDDWLEVCKEVDAKDAEIERLQKEVKRFRCDFTHCQYRRKADQAQSVIDAARKIDETIHCQIVDHPGWLQFEFFAPQLDVFDIAKLNEALDTYDKVIDDD